MRIPQSPLSLLASQRGADSRSESYFLSAMSGLDFTIKLVLQVAEARPVAAQADVMERELESCLRQEYTPESLPLLLHQVTSRGQPLIFLMTL